MTIRPLYPDIPPSLDLNFARTKRLDPLVTFSRSSAGTYVDVNGLIRTAAANEARFDHSPTTGESLGLLVEEARTNLRINSEVVSGWDWVGGQANSVDSNVIAAPDGTLTADNRYGNSGNWTAAQLLESNITVAAGQSIVMSVYAKYVPSSKYQWISLNLDISGSATSRVVFNLQTGAITFTSAISGYAEQLPNGWFRLVAVRINTSGFSQTWGYNNARIFALDTSSGDLSSGSGTGSATDGVYLWGGQVEVSASALASSYISTAGSQVTRSADVASITGTNFSSWYNQGGGTLLANFTKISTVINFPLGLGYDGSNYIGLGYQTNEFLWIQQLHGVVQTGTLSSITNRPLRAAVGYSSSGSTLCVDNSTFNKTATGPLPTGSSGTLYLGSSPFAPGSILSSRFARLTYWPTRLSDAMLQNLTR